MFTFYRSNNVMSVICPLDFCIERAACSPISIPTGNKEIPVPTSNKEISMLTGTKEISMPTGNKILLMGNKDLHANG